MKTRAQLLKVDRLRWRLILRANPKLKEALKEVINRVALKVFNDLAERVAFEIGRRCAERGIIL